ncbi:MAG: 50S ribosomal protein L11 methyltransferase [Anaerolineales bacterium]|nr:MAG: 50S ribosomal protein L11 methyltransferase [Anaerolineales bacterium]
MKWLEVSFTAEGELAEAIADLLARFASGGVAIESDQIVDDDAEGHPIGPVGVRAYLPVGEHLQAQRQRLEEGLWHLGQILSLPEPSYRLLPEEDWKHSWQESHHPVRVGRRLLILPAWSQAPIGDRLPLILDPDMAFGTGTHPTTRLCLAALEDHLHPGQTVIDLGCGSGILSIAAARLGASQVYAWDIDPQAVQVARRNVIRNELSETIQVKVGSLSELLAEGKELSPTADLLLANILASTLKQMILTGLSQAVAVGGILILSGILDQQVKPLLATSAKHSLQLIEIRAEDDWRALVLMKQ